MQKKYISNIFSDKKNGGIIMDVDKAIQSRRSIRRFQQKPVSIDLLNKMVDNARLAPSAANLQPLEFIIVNEKGICENIFKTLNWAGYIKPKWTPEPNERPVAYIIIIVKDINNPWYQRDTSYAAGSIVLTAESYNIGSCILCKIDRDKIKEILNIPEELIVDSVIALGYKAEHPVVEDLTNSVKYYRDEYDVLHVPKRRLDEILHYNSYKKS